MNSLFFLTLAGVIATVWWGRDQQLAARRAQRAYVKLDGDYQALWEAHDRALDDLDGFIEASIDNAKAKHPASRFTLVRGEGA
jgi:hypothetical protein